MPDVESMEIIGDGPVEPPPGARFGAWLGQVARRRGRLAGRLALVGLVLVAVTAIVAVLVLRAQLDAQRRLTPEPTAAQRAAVAAVLAWAHALDSHDAVALDDSIVADAGVLVVSPGDALEQPFTDRAFLTGGRPAYAPDLRFQVLDSPRAVQDLQVTLTARLTSGGRSSTEQTVVNLERRGPRVKVSAVVMTTAPNDSLPSEG